MQKAATKRPPLLVASFLPKPVGKNRQANTHARTCSNAVKLTAAMNMLPTLLSTRPTTQPEKEAAVRLLHNRTV